VKFRSLERKQRPARQALTLLEVLLVLAVLALLAAAAWPSLERSLADQRLRNAADVVRAEWSHARAKAMSSGVAQQFCHEPDGRGYWIEARDEGTAVANADAAAPSAAADGFADARRPGQSFLPDGIFFFTENTPIIFYPDGACTTARIVLRNENDRGIALSIRGLTAVSAVGEIFQLEEVAQ